MDWETTKASESINKGRQKQHHPRFPVRFKSRHQVADDRCPLFPQQRTIARATSWSAFCAISGSRRAFSKARASKDPMTRMHDRSGGHHSGTASAGSHEPRQIASPSGPERNLRLPLAFVSLTVVLHPQGLERRHHSQVRTRPWTTFFNGDSASNKLTAATLPAAEDSTRLFLPRAGAPRRWTVF